MIKAESRRNVVAWINDLNDRKITFRTKLLNGTHDRPNLIII
jgi:hypothetical protein